MARTQTEVEDRRLQILEAALRVFAQKGFVRATNKDIAKEAGITPGLIYHYFDSKEGLLKAAIDEYSPLRLIHAPPADLLAQTPEKFLRIVAGQLLTILEDEHFVRLMRVFLPEAIYHPEIPLYNLPAMQEVINFLARYFSAKMESGEMRKTNASMVAQIFGGSLMAFVIRRHLLHDPLALEFTHEEIVEEVVGIVLHGVLTR